MNDNKPSVPCKWCGKQTKHVGTMNCDSCWELSTRITADIRVTAKMLKHLLHPEQLAIFKQLLNEPYTSLGAKLYECRRRIVESGEPLTPAAELLRDKE